MSETNKAVAKKGVDQHEMSDFELSMAAKNQFFVTTLNMSWQLAIAVLVPVLGGHFLDQKFDTGYLYFTIGFVLAIAGMCLVVWRQISLIEPIVPSAKKGKK